MSDITDKIFLSKNVKHESWKKHKSLIIKALQVIFGENDPQKILSYMDLFR